MEKETKDGEKEKSCEEPIAKVAKKVVNFAKLQGTDEITFENLAWAYGVHSRKQYM